MEPLATIKAYYLLDEGQSITPDLNGRIEKFTTSVTEVPLIIKSTYLYQYHKQDKYQMCF